MRDRTGSSRAHRGRRPRSAGTLPRALAVVTAAAAVLHAAPALAQEHAAERGAQGNPRWAAIRELFGQGKAEGGYFRVELPRTDLHVRIGSDTLDPRFEFTSYIGFAPSGARDVLAMGEIILLQDEVPAVLSEASRRGVSITAVHNHLTDEQPRIMYVHVMARGAPATVAAELRALFARSATPLAPPTERRESTGDWLAIDAVLGRHSEAEGSVAEYVFPRREALRVHGVSVKSSGTLETASEVVFQRLGGRRVASTGELYLRAAEVGPVVRELEGHGLHVTALHHHMLDDGPPHFWVHWYATGDGATLARGIAAALAHTNGARRAVAEE